MNQNDAHSITAMPTSTPELISHVRTSNEANPGAMRSKITLDRSTLETLLNHATSAAQLVGHLDDAIAAGPLGDHVDAIAHGLTELLGDRHKLAAPEAVAPADRVAYDGAPMLTSGAGGAR
jgi:hypothetical protein